VKLIFLFVLLQKTYKCTSDPRGAVFIINNIFKEHDHHSERKGAIIDEKNLKKLFEDMSYYVFIHRDYTKTVIFCAIGQIISKMDSSECHALLTRVSLCFLFVILDHQMHLL